MDENNIDSLNNNMNTLNSCLNEYVKENDDLDNPLSNLMINSPYYDMNGLINNLESKETDTYQAKVLHLNIRSLSSKFDSLITLLNSLQTNRINLDFILLCETFLHDGNKHLFNIPGYNLVFKNRSNMARGGVAIYVKESIQYKLREDLMTFIEGEYESIFIETNISNNKTIIGEIYRVPNSNLQKSLERYEQILSQIKDTKNVIIATDQNMDLLNIESHKHTAELLNNMFASSLIPTINKPTRITHSTATLIDNIYVKFNDFHTKVKSAILVDDISDHLPVFCFISYNKPSSRKHQKPLTFEKRNINDNTINLINNAIQHTNWNYLDNLNVNESFESLTNKLKDMLDKYAPLEKITIPHKNIIRNPWLSKGLMKSSHTCGKLYSKCINKPKTDITYKSYIKYRNMYNRLKKIAKQAYYAQIFNDAKRDIRKTWKIINATIGKLNDKTNIPQTFKIDNKNISDPNIITDKFCDFFTDIGVKYANNISPSAKSSANYLQLKKTKKP